MQYVVFYFDVKCHVSVLLCTFYTSMCLLLIFVCEKIKYYTAFSKDRVRQNVLQ